MSRCFGLRRLTARGCDRIAPCEIARTTSASARGPEQRRIVATASAREQIAELLPPNGMWMRPTEIIEFEVTCPGRRPSSWWVRRQGARAQHLHSRGEDWNDLSGHGAQGCCALPLPGRGESCCGSRDRPTSSTADSSATMVNSALLGVSRRVQRTRCGMNRRTASRRGNGGGTSDRARLSQALAAGEHRLDAGAHSARVDRRESAGSHRQPQDLCTGLEDVVING